MPKRSESSIKPITPKSREAGIRVLERAFGEHGASGEPLEALWKYLNKSVVVEKPQLKDDKDEILNYERFLFWRLTEIITGSQKKIPAKKENQIIDKFVANSIAKYLSQKNETSDSE